ncbi:hypothetical protein FQN49_008224, partial [Arthroderma sp. PD_2]
AFPDAVDRFLQTYLRLWDGISNRTAILDLLEYAPIHDDGLFQHYFLPLENAMLDNTMESKGSLLRYYAALIRRYGSILRSNASVNSAIDLATIIGRAELISLTLLECPVVPNLEESNINQSFSSSVVQFYVQLAELYLHAPTNSLIRLNTPPPESVYILAFTPVLSNISLMSAVIANYKSSFEQSLATTTSHGSSRRPYPDAVVTNLNGYVLDICNLLWRNRGLNDDEPNALGCLVRKEVTKLLTEYIQGVGEDLAKKGKNGGIYRLRLASIFSLSHHAALCGMSAMCFRNLESNEGKDGMEVSARLTWPVTQKALNALNKAGGIKVDWQEYRLKMLEWLDEHGSGGIGRLMRNSMMTLRQG